MKETFHVQIGDREHTLTLERAGEQWLVELDGKKRTVDCAVTGVGRYSLLIDGHSCNPVVEEAEDGVRVTVAQEEFFLVVRDELEKRLDALGARKSEHAGASVVKSIMPGMVSRVEVKEGDLVEKGRALLTLEAMKMENEIKSPIRGRVKKLFVGKGQTVGKGDKLAEIEAV